MIPARAAGRTAALVLACIASTACRAIAGTAAAGPAVPGDPSACSADASSIRIRVVNVQDAQGTITVDLHGDRPEDFLRKQMTRVRVPAVIPETVVCIPIERPGNYAVALYHDRNANLHLDKNLIGIPSEPVGISNDPRFFLRAPRFDEAVFAAGDHGADLVITLRDVL